MALLILYSLALLGLAQQQVTTPNLTIIPKSDDSATGCVDLRELSANGINKACLKAADSIYANRIVTLPEYTTTLIGDQNYAYGSAFAIRGTRANGTEASPTDVIAGNTMFQFLGRARSGGSSVNAAGINFLVGTASPLTTYATIELSNASVFGTAYAFEISRFYSTNTPDVGISFARFGNFYGNTADFSIPGTADTSWVTTQNFQILDNAGGTAFWRWKGYANAVNKYVWLEDDAGSTYAQFSTNVGAVPFRRAQLKAGWDPWTDNTYSLGTSGARWSDVRTHDVHATGTIGGPIFDLTAGGSNSYRVGGVDIIDSSRNAAFADLNISGTCTGCPGGTGSAPLGEVKITDYGATSNCTTPTTIRTALASAIAALPLDSAGLHSGPITAPAGCYGWDVANGSMLFDRSLGHGDIWLIGAGAGSEFAAVGAGTEIRAIGSAPASATAMVEFRKILGGGIRNIQLNAAGISNTRILKVRESRFGHYENVQGRRWTSGPGLEFASESGATSGSCHNNFIGLNLGDVKDTDQASGILFDGQVAGYSACSNKFTHGIVIYSKSGSATYGIKQKYADNNTLDRFNVWASDCTAFPCESNAGTGRTNGTMPAFTMEQYSGDKTFPKENFFDGTLTAANGYLITGVSGTSGNRINHTLDDCGGLLVGCVPTSIRNIRGATSYGEWMQRSAFPHLDANQGTYTVDQTNGSFNSGGRINFNRQDRVLAAVGADFSNGLTFSTGQPSACNLYATVGSRSPHASANSLSNIFVSGGIAIASTASAHGCAIGDRIRVSESTVANLTGEFAVTNTPSSTQIQWNTSAANGTYNSDGLTVEIAPKPWWSIAPSGLFAPVSDGLTSIGNTTYKPANVWSQSFRSYTSNGYGAQTHQLIADQDLNLNMDSYGSSGSNYRPFLNLRRGEGSLGSPSAVAANDRLGGIATWAYVSGGFTVGAVIESFVTAISGTNVTADLRFRTTNAGTTQSSSAPALQILGSGAASFLSTVDATTYNATGSPAFRVGGQTAIDNSRNFTSGNVTPISGTTYDVGSSSSPYNNIIGTTLQAYSSGVLRAQLAGTFNMWNSSSVLVFNVSNTGNVSAAGAYSSGGSGGTTTSFTCGTGLAVKSMNVQGGIVVSVTCGTP